MEAEAGEGGARAGGTRGAAWGLGAWVQPGFWGRSSRDLEDLVPSGSYFICKVGCGARRRGSVVRVDLGTGRPRFDSRSGYRPR